VRGPLPLMEPWQFSYFYANILLWGPQARVVPVASPVYGMIHLDGGPMDVRMYVRHKRPWRKRPWRSS
jgi:hypothetical protein